MTSKQNKRRVKMYNFSVFSKLGRHQFKIDCYKSMMFYVTLVVITKQKHTTYTKERERNICISL